MKTKMTAEKLLQSKHVREIRKKQTKPPCVCYIITLTAVTETWTRNKKIKQKDKRHKTEKKPTRALIMKVTQYWVKRWEILSKIHSRIMRWGIQKLIFVLSWECLPNERSNNDVFLFHINWKTLSGTKPYVWLKILENHISPVSFPIFFLGKADFFFKGLQFLSNLPCVYITSNSDLSLLTLK